MSGILSGKSIALLLAGLLLAACSNAPVTEIVSSKPEQQRIEPGKTVFINVSRTSAISLEDFSVVSRFLKDGLRVGLVGDGIFRAVENEKASADYVLNLSVLEARRIGGARRALLGFLAPRSSVLVAVDLRDRATDQVVQSHQVAGRGGRSGYSQHSYGLDDPARKAAETIVLVLQGAEPG